MPTSGLVISTTHVDGLPAILAALDSRSEITCGEPRSRRLPIVTDTASKEDDQALWQWLWELPGIASVDVAFISLESNGDSTENADCGNHQHPEHKLGH